MFKHSRILAAFGALCAMLATLTAVAVAAAASALAAPQPLPNDELPIQQQPITVEHVSNGSPIWVFVVVAAVTALVSVATALAVGRLRQARRSTAYA